MTWYDFKAPPGRENALGSEGGKIILDEEHLDGARITLEHNCETARFAITCGIYGWMVHTRFFKDETEARREYAAMRDLLGAIVDRIYAADDPLTESNIDEITREISDFVDRFP